MSNIPGMDYLVRVGNLWNNLLIKQSSEMEKAWSEIKDRKYNLQNAFSVWATAVEDYFGFAVDASKGPGYIARPAWLYFAYSADPKKRSTLSYTARLDRSESPATVLDMTDFACLDKGSTSSFLPGKPLYEQCNVNGDQIEVVLDKNLLKQTTDDATRDGKALNGEYISFVFGKNRGPEPPLLIVVLSIRDCPPVKK